MRTPRGIDRALFQKLVADDWIERAEGLLITGPTGVGKSWIACALGHKACRDGKSVLYHRAPRLFEALASPVAMAVTVASSRPWRASSS